MRCNAMVHVGHIKIVIKTSRSNCFLERTNREYIIDRFCRVIRTLSVNSTQFVESRGKLLNTYNEPSLSVMRTRLSPALARPFTPLISCICTVAYGSKFRPRQLAHVFQYTDFFNYNRCRVILTYDKQLHYLPNDAIFFLTALRC